jgi:hypothetical protein
MDPLGTDSGSLMIGRHSLETTGAVDTVNMLQTDHRRNRGSNSLKKQEFILLAKPPCPSLEPT